MGIAEDLIIIIIAGLIAGLIANRFKIPPIIGYILAGIAIGPFTGGITVSDVPRIELLAEIGVALLLFSIGLDFSFKELKTVRGIAFIGTPVQIIVLIFFGYAIATVMDMPWNRALIFGMVISLSSTMVVLKTLISRGLTGTLSSRVMIGILIMQDLIAIPLMLIIPELGAGGFDFIPLVVTLAKALAILCVIVIVGTRVMPFILKRVARLNSRELFLVTVTAMGLGVGYLTHIFGLSLAFGAFGMVISESDYSHQALSDIIPLRDIFGLVFFTSIGMLVDPSFIRGNLTEIIILVLLIITGKFIVFSSLSMIFRYHNIIPLALGLGLAQIGEFSFVLARSGLKSGVVDSDFYSLILSVSIVTMIMSPFMSMLAAPLYSLKRKFFSHERIETVNMGDEELKNHIVIAGGGRVGFQIASVFNKLGFPFLLVEQDYYRFEKSKNEGFPVIYGDAGQETVLEGALIDDARMVIVTIPDIITARSVVEITQKRNAGARIISRADDMSQLDDLYGMNVYEVVQPEFEASLEIIRQVLLYLDVPAGSIYGITDDIRQRNYKEFRSGISGDSVLSNIRKVPFILDMSWMEVLPESYALGRTIRDMEVRTKTGVSIVGVLRKDNFIPNPGADFIFNVGDHIAVMGDCESKENFSVTMLNSDRGVCLLKEDGL